jgi:hypothetical protein
MAAMNMAATNSVARENHLVMVSMTRPSRAVARFVSCRAR